MPDNVHILWENLKEFDSSITLKFVQENYNGGDPGKEVSKVLALWMSSPHLTFVCTKNSISLNNGKELATPIKDFAPMEAWDHPWPSTLLNIDLANREYVLMLNRMIACLTLHALHADKNVYNQAISSATRFTHYMQTLVDDSFTHTRVYNNFGYKASLKGISDTIIEATPDNVSPAPMRNRGGVYRRVNLRWSDQIEYADIGCLYFYDTGIALSLPSKVWWFAPFIRVPVEKLYNVEAWMCSYLMLHMAGLINSDGEFRRPDEVHKHTRAATENMPQAGMCTISGIHALNRFMLQCDKKVVPPVYTN